uniref:Fission protein ELM1 n=1 Tax=Candidatus Kentrum sp. SD TaxID=2126332 RepID=A0A451BJP5_9GAMM|nr:MAG: hypothetical protein BECKSD772D_GA0070982_101522 [Candidatus Kentron sp. SD]
MMGSIVVWRFRDGKRGHENQTRGLVQALERLAPIASSDIPVTPGLSHSLGALFGRPFRTNRLPDPDLLIGAGHGTHLPLLAGAHARGGRTVVLMKPTLPIRWFDLCVIPAHDGVRPRANVFTTRGVLNPMTYHPHREGSKTGLLLIGGPSRHHGWDEEALFRQIDAIVARESETTWIATTSRRTPPSTTHALMGRQWKNLRSIPCADTPDGWLSEQLARARTAWVTEDSVSMIYEALTSGAPTGILSVPRRVATRVSLGVDQLVADGLVTGFSHWHGYREKGDFRGGEAHAGRNAPSAPARSLGASPDSPSRGPFDEAARCARWLLDQWFANR